MPTIALNQLGFRHRRAAAPALREVTLTLGDGVVGLVGPNGAGKTTLLRLLLGALRPQSGSVHIDGLDPDAYRAARTIGFLPERPAIEPYVTVAEFLEGVASLAGAAAPEIPGVAPLRPKRLGDLSQGEMRRVEIAAALCGDPDLLLLDEPTNGLDPLGVGFLRQAVLAARRAGRTILLSSHQLDELQRLVDVLVLVRAGRIAACWPREEALARHGSFDQLFHATFDALDPAEAR